MKKMKEEYIILKEQNDEEEEYIILKEQTVVFTK